MTTKRIIACLDVKDGNVVKGVNFLNLQLKGDPVSLASLYEEEGADEIVFLDITATIEARKALYNVIKDTASVLSIPLTVGGGIRTPDDVSMALRSGADKVSINTAAVESSQIVKKSAEEFGSQAVVVAIDVKKVSGNWIVFTKSGTYNTRLDAIKWAKKVEELGAGEILLTSIDRDGTRLGYDLELTRKIVDSVNIPVIASGGAGKMEHFYEVFSLAKADAALAAGIFHDGIIKIKDLKSYLSQKGIEVRM
ncbi:imidazole glycerol phosphate synthase subunit HisF [Saccharolobus solfataricus]|uniref:Imidazole glycerol phosphate synthase subunit HisF n=3 Tax=Saccharolobus solfataricus TaxID=2287 RepID=HIS6_SACS2|nr:imidazole glycerol phosphate synthase subunit HisF [Saccharolobus solfataricus]O33774.1 RecName: Full=Imidazole glycerol phosphate synthase subunit HisF; AltName: Full=IGP synthase cyclase subunit; AltName: Full=IGP synthase subunit HisF; AltName: Full=ImGP synthase subunit HisF; Short=IGPS subunit HisF [Saccharolobus solfataricus P2]AAB63022.1 cyclase [Saccharolobus solfataricus P2]AAK40908.1 Imidazoleglycerol-phosphate synthase, cyclase subunit (hisF) [Saccharolobus solfataricus P2]AKA7393